MKILIKFYCAKIHFLVHFVRTVEDKEYEKKTSLLFFYKFEARVANDTSLCTLTILPKYTQDTIFIFS